MHRALTRQDAASLAATALAALLLSAFAASHVIHGETRALDGQDLHIASPVLAASTPWLLLSAVLTALSCSALVYVASSATKRLWVGPLAVVGVLLASCSAILYAAPHGYALEFFPAMRRAYDAAWCLLWLPLPLALSALAAAGLLRRWPVAAMQLALSVAATFLALQVAPALSEEHALLRVDVPCFVLPPTTLHAGLSRAVPREAITRLGTRQAPPGRWLPGGMISEPSPGSAHDLAELAAHRRFRERMEHIAGWHFDPIQAPGETGPAQITLRATRGLLEVTAEAEIHVAREDGDARFPLPAGRRLRYAVASRTELTIEVMPYEVEEGLRIIPLTITRRGPATDDLRVTTERIVPLDGAYVWAPSARRRETPFLAPAHVPGRAMSALFGDCLLGPQGPALCTATDEANNVGIVIATFLTAGLAAPFLAGNVNRRIVTELVSVDGVAL
jgi:hypothetical protein